jgi:hypothetical protein
MAPSCGGKGYWSKFQCITGVPHGGFTSQVGLMETKVEPADDHLLFHLRKPKKSIRTKHENWLDDWNL